MNPLAKSRLPLLLAALSMAGSLTLSQMAFAKHASFELPACDRLMEGDGPRTAPHESVEETTAALETSVPEKTAPAKSAPSKPAPKDLSPMKLTNDADSFSVDKNGQVKMTVQQNVENAADKTAPEAPSTDGTAESIIKTKDGDLGDKLLKQGKAVNIQPLALLESEEESQKKADTMSDSEKVQLTDLWAATINRSPDIQFVINRLQPNSDANHTTATALKMLSGALFSAVQAVPLMMGPAANPAMFMGVGSGTSMLGNLLADANSKNAKKQQISQEQATILYKIVRDTADKLVLEYRKYRKCRSDFDRSVGDLEDIKSMVAQARTGQDPARQIEMEYVIRKAQRDVDNVNDDARMHRQSLADLAGPDAVAKLDGQIEQEVIALQKLTGGEGLKQAELDQSHSSHGIQAAGDPATQTH